MFRPMVPRRPWGDDEGMNPTTPDSPLLLCYDGSDHAANAIEDAARLFAGEHALVLAVWQPLAGLDVIAWAGATASMVDFVDLDQAAAQDGGRVAEAGARLAREAGLEADAVAVKAAGPIWKTILEVGKQHHAATIVLGSRGLTGIRSMLLGSVSGAVVQHADRPTLVVHRPDHGDADEG